MGEHAKVICLGSKWKMDGEFFLLIEEYIDDRKKKKKDLRILSVTPSTFQGQPSLSFKDKVLKRMERTWNYLHYLHADLVEIQQIHKIPHCHVKNWEEEEEEASVPPTHASSSSRGKWKEPMVQEEEEEKKDEEEED